MGRKVEKEVVVGKKKVIITSAIAATVVAALAITGISYTNSQQQAQG
jgi:hypothetical protein